jgi:hypothetical protein
VSKPRVEDLKGYALKAARGERPFRYSDQYNDWRHAVQSNDDERIEAAHLAWARRFTPWVFERPRKFRRVAA